MRKIVIEIGKHEIHAELLDTPTADAVYKQLSFESSGYDVSQLVRKRIEEIFGWGKDVGPIRKTKFRGKDRVGFQLLLTLAGYNLPTCTNLGR